ncbi:MAG: iron-sulfur cluster biosynthesis family protein [Thermoplasmata archaeon]
MTVKVEVTTEARNQVRSLIQGQKPGTGVRVYLESAEEGGCGCGGGGCGCGGGASGPRFGMAFDQKRPGDQVIPVDGFSLLVDDLSADLLDGGSIDYIESLEATGFKIQAPKLEALRQRDEAGSSSDEDGSGCGAGGCGCGN